MDLAPTFHAVVALVARSTRPADGWSELVAYLGEKSGATVELLRDVAIIDDVHGAAEQLRELCAAEPPPTSVNAVYFGLFDTSDDDGVEGIGFYVSGVEDFDPNDPDSLCSPAWWPEGRYLQSAALDAVKELEVDCRGAGNSDAASLLGYAGQLGAAMLVAKFASGLLFGARKIVVGFDSGDFVEVPR